MNTTKLFSIFLVLVLSVLFSVGAASALTIQEVKVDGVELASDSQIVHADRGETVDVTVQLKGGSTDEDSVRIKAWIGGYKYDEVEDVTSQFKVLADTVYVKNLEFEIPEDMDSTEDYTLHVEAYGPTGDEVEYDSLSFTLRVTPVQDLLGIQDVIFNPGLSVKAGNALYAKVRVENTGDNKQEDIRVSMNMPALGISVRDYIDELVSEEQCDVSDCDDDEETSATSNELMLKLPESVKTGTYALEIVVDYDRLHESVRKVFLLSVEGRELVDEQTQINRIISVDTATKEVDPGKGIIYRLTAANLGAQTETYTVEVSGVDTWATSRVDPALVTVASDSTGELFVYISANENAVPGLHMFTVKVKSGDTTVKEFNLGADVKEVAKAGTLSLASILWMVFAVLVIVVAVLGVILLVKRSKEDNAEEPSTEAQTYY